MEFDYLIIGAGLAGCTCARLLAQKGAEVLVIECEDLGTKDKLCGGLITPRAARILEELYGLDAERLYMQDHREMHVVVGDYQQTVPCSLIHSLRRADLDRLALEKALEAGAGIIDMARMRTLDLDRQVATVEIDNEVFRIGFKTLIGADGANSWTRRAVCQNTTPASLRLAPSIEAYVDANGAPLTGKYSTQVRGYGWYAPCGNVANIGFEGTPGTKGADLRRELFAFSRELGVEIKPGALRGAFIPSGGSIKLQLGKADVCFIGDAAGLAAPATGEGIYYALRSAQLLARSLTMGGASYRRRMGGEVAVLKRQYNTFGLLFNETILNRVIAFSNFSGLGMGNAAKAALKLFASF